MLIGSGMDCKSVVPQTVALPSVAEVSGRVDTTRSATRMNTVRACRILTRLILSPLKVAHDGSSQIHLVPSIFDANIVGDFTV